MQARYYDPVIGRFLSTDPIGYQDQLNLYAYVHNDPVNATDPTGLYASVAAQAAQACGKTQPCRSAVANTIGALFLLTRSELRKDNPLLVFRGLSFQDVGTLAAGAGIIARNPAGGLSIAEHQSGDFGSQSQYISTSRSFVVASEIFGQEFGTVALDTRKIGQVGIDVAASSEPGVNHDLATEEQEVLYQGAIPQAAVAGYAPPGSNQLQKVKSGKLEFKGYFKVDATRLGGND